MEKIFLLSKPKVAYVYPFTSSQPFPKFQKQNFQVFWTQTCRKLTELFI